MCTTFGCSCSECVPIELSATETEGFLVIDGAEPIEYEATEAKVDHHWTKESLVFPLPSHRNLFALIFITVFTMALWCGVIHVVTSSSAYGALVFPLIATLLGIYELNEYLSKRQLELSESELRYVKKGLWTVVDSTTYLNVYRVATARYGRANTVAERLSIMSKERRRSYCHDMVVTTEENDIDLGEGLAKEKQDWLKKLVGGAIRVAKVKKLIKG